MPKNPPMSKSPEKSAKKIVRAMKAWFKGKHESGEECYELWISTVTLHTKKFNGVLYELHGPGYDGKPGYCEQVKDFATIDAIGKALGSLALKVKGVQILDYLKHTHVSNSWYSFQEVTDFTLPNKFRKFGKITKEWTALCKKVKKMSGVDLEPWQTVVQGGSGKRGHIYSWDTSWYVAWDCPKWCAEMAEWLKKNKKGRDALRVEQFAKVTVDDEAYSIEHEVECTGSKITSYRFTVVTPRGKVKATRTLSRYGE